MSVVIIGKIGISITCFYLFEDHNLATHTATHLGSPQRSRWTDNSGIDQSGSVAGG